MCQESCLVLCTYSIHLLNIHKRSYMLVLQFQHFMFEVSHLHGLTHWKMVWECGFESQTTWVHVSSRCETLAKCTRSGNWQPVNVRVSIIYGCRHSFMDNFKEFSLASIYMSMVPSNECDVARFWEQGGAACFTLAGTGTGTRLHLLWLLWKQEVSNTTNSSLSFCSVL